MIYVCLKLPLFPWLYTHLSSRRNWKVPDWYLIYPTQSHCKSWAVALPATVYSLLFCSHLFFHVLLMTILIWWVWPVIIFVWLMSEEVGRLITAQQFCKWLIGVWREEWETFKEVYGVRGKEDDINNTSGQQRQSERRQPLWKVYWKCTWLKPH